MLLYAMRLTVFGVWAILGFVLSAIVNALSYVGIAAQEALPAVWMLHVGLFPPFGAMVFRSRRLRGTDGRGSSAWRQYLPARAYAVSVAVMVYVAFNFFTATSHLPRRGEQQSTDPARAHEVNVYTVRAFSGVWLIFYLAPALFFSFVPASASSRSLESGLPTDEP